MAEHVKIWMCGHQYEYSQTLIIQTLINWIFNIQQTQFSSPYLSWILITHIQNPLATFSY